MILCINLNKKKRRSEFDCINYKWHKMQKWAKEKHESTAVKKRTLFDLN